MSDAFGGRQPTSHERLTGEPWDASYADGPAPWDVGHPQPAVVRRAATGGFAVLQRRGSGHRTASRDPERIEGGLQRWLGGRLHRDRQGRDEIPRRSRRTRLVRNHQATGGLAGEVPVQQGLALIGVEAAPDSVWFLDREGVLEAFLDDGAHRAQ